MLIIKSIIALLYLSILSSTSLAAPVPSPDATTGDSVHLVARTPPVPRKAVIKTHLNVPQDTSLFYSGSNGRPIEGSLKDALRWARTKQNGYKVIGQLWRDKKWPKRWENLTPRGKEFFDLASEAMAEMSSGTVYVMLPPWQEDKMAWWSGSVWARIEWPALLSNDAVTKVIRVDPAGNEIAIKG